MYGDDAGRRLQFVLSLLEAVDLMKRHVVPLFYQVRSQFLDDGLDSAQRKRIHRSGRTHEGDIHRLSPTTI